MAWMIPYAKLTLYHLGHPRQGPQIRGKTGGQRALQQDVGQLFPLLPAQAGGPPRMRFPFQRLQAALIQGLLPATDRRRGSAYQTPYFAHPFAFSEELGRKQTPCFQFFRTSFRSHGHPPLKIGSDSRELLWPEMFLSKNEVQ